eukprot:5768729-Lingulodinium_polyedra.AAC.1
MLLSRFPRYTMKRTRPNMNFSASSICARTPASAKTLRSQVFRMRTASWRGGLVAQRRVTGVSTALAR